MIELSKDYLLITPDLKAHWLKALDDSHAGILVSFKKGGCTGQELTVELLENEHDKPASYVMIDDNKKLYIDQHIMHVFAGGTLDYVQEGLNKVVKLEGPNLAGACGCGQSYDLGQK